MTGTEAGTEVGRGDEIETGTGIRISTGIGDMERRKMRVPSVSTNQMQCVQSLA